MQRRIKANVGSDEVSHRFGRLGTDTDNGESVYLFSLYNNECEVGPRQATYLRQHIT